MWSIIKNRLTLNVMECDSEAFDEEKRFGNVVPRARLKFRTAGV